MFVIKKISVCLSDIWNITIWTCGADLIMVRHVITLRWLWTKNTISNLQTSDDGDGNNDHISELTTQLSPHRGMNIINQNVVVNICHLWQWMKWLTQAAII